MASLDDVLNEPKEPREPAAPAAPAEAPTEGAEAPPPVQHTESLRKQARAKEYAAQGRDPETGQFIPKDDKAGSPPEPAAPVKEAAPAAPPAPPAPQQFTDKEKAFLAEADRQRRRAQQLEERIKAIEASKPKEPEKTFFDDPDGRLAKHEAEMRSIAVNTRMQTAELIARSKYPDFDQKVEEFGKLLQVTPGLHQQWLAAPDPAEYAYKAAKAHMDLQAAGSVDALREQIRKEERVKLEAELKEKSEALEKQRKALPPSLSNARGTTVNKPVWGGPTPLDSILKV